MEYVWLTYIGSTAYALCMLPQIVKTVRSREADSFSWGMLILWSVGGLTIGAWSLLNELWVMLADYVINIVGVSLLIYYKSVGHKRTGAGITSSGHDEVVPSPIPTLATMPFSCVRCGKEAITADPAVYVRGSSKDDRAYITTCLHCKAKAYAAYSERSGWVEIPGSVLNKGGFRWVQDTQKTK